MSKRSVATRHNMDRRCYKCDRLHSQAPIKTPRRRRSSSSILYSGLLANANGGKRQVPFTMKLGMGSHKQLILPFLGSYIDGDSGWKVYSSESGIQVPHQRSSPYFSEIDLKQPYIRKELARPLKGTRRKFPGYEVSQKGTIQLIVFNQERTVTSVLLLPYDLTSLAANTKKIVKFKVYKEIVYRLDGADHNLTLRKLVSEVEAKFVNYKDKQCYLFDSLKLLFAGRTSNSDDCKLPLNLYDTKLSSLQFNPKVPLLPINVHSAVDTIESEPFKIDLDYYTCKCSHCDTNDSQYSGIY